MRQATGLCLVFAAPHGSTALSLLLPPLSKYRCPSPLDFASRPRSMPAGAVATYLIPGSAVFAAAYKRAPERSRCAWRRAIRTPWRKGGKPGADGAVARGAPRAGGGQAGGGVTSVAASGGNLLLRFTHPVVVRGVLTPRIKSMPANTWRHAAFAAA